MKIKMFYAPSYREGEEMVNKFIQGKKIYDIKFNLNIVKNQDHYMFLIMYDEHHA